MNTFKQSAIEILKREQKPLHYTKITQLALESGILETEGGSPENTMSSVITVDIKSKKGGSDFIRKSIGIYSLNPIKKEIIQTPKIIEAEKEEEEKIKVESGFIGKGGEHLVCSELLFRGFNASIMSVDVGVDISAIKDDKFFGIQVKTARINTYKTHNFHIRRSSFEKHNQKHIFYVLVLRDGEQNRYLVLPSKDVEAKIKEGAIYAVNNRTGYSLSVKFRDEKIYLGKKDIGKFLDKWDLIK